jgi:hypothetical protein
LQTSFETLKGLERKVETALENFNIPFTKQAILKRNLMTKIVDIAIPTNQNPKYIIEIKSRFQSSFIFNLLLQFTTIKTMFPKTKIILISDYHDLPKNFLNETLAIFDHKVDFEELEQLKDIIKL